MAAKKRKKAKKAVKKAPAKKKRKAKKKQALSQFKQYSSEYCEERGFGPSSSIYGCRQLFF